MSVPDNAVDVAARAYWAVVHERGMGTFELQPWESLEPDVRRDVSAFVTPILDAARQAIAAQALRDEADKLDAWCGCQKVNTKDVSAELRNHADALDPS